MKKYYIYCLLLLLPGCDYLGWSGAGTSAHLIQLENKAKEMVELEDYIENYPEGDSIFVDSSPRLEVFAIDSDWWLWAYERLDSSERKKFDERNPSVVYKLRWLRQKLVYTLFARAAAKSPEIATFDRVIQLDLEDWVGRPSQLHLYAGATLIDPQTREELTFYQLRETKVAIPLQAGKDHILDLYWRWWIGDRGEAGFAFQEGEQKIRLHIQIDRLGKIAMQNTSLIESYNIDRSFPYLLPSQVVFADTSAGSAEIALRTNIRKNEDDSTDWKYPIRFDLQVANFDSINNPATVEPLSLEVSGKDFGLEQIADLRNWWAAIPAEWKHQLHHRQAKLQVVCDSIGTAKMQVDWLNNTQKLLKELVGYKLIGQRLISGAKVDGRFKKISQEKAERQSIWISLEKTENPINSGFWRADSTTIMTVDSLLNADRDTVIGKMKIPCIWNRNSPENPKISKGVMLQLLELGKRIAEDTLAKASLKNHRTELILEGYCNKLSTRAANAENSLEWGFIVAERLRSFLPDWLAETVHIRLIGYGIAADRELPESYGNRVDISVGYGYGD